DSRWQSMRNVIISIYQPSHVASLIPAIQPYVERAGRLLHPGEEITFSDLSLKLFSDTIGQVAFGVHFGLTKDMATSPPPLQEPAAAKSVDPATDFIRKHFHATTTSLKMCLSGSLSIVLGQFVPFLQEPLRQLLLRVPGSADRRLEETNSAMSGLLDEIVAERAAQADGDQKNFLSVLLNASESTEVTKKLLTPDYLGIPVAMHPEVEEKLLREIDAFGPKDVVPSSDDLQTKFPYVERFLKETMRFCTASSLVTREASEDVEVGAYLLPKRDIICATVGTWVWLTPGVLAKDPKDDFLDPDMFRPERFVPESEEYVQAKAPLRVHPLRHRPRACIGQKFAMQQLKLVVIHLYRNYIFRHSPRMEFPLQFQYFILVNFKYGVKVQVIERKN
uniref:Cytochrome P450 n=1 Tax=Setaria italica TaxID=4555 RepID=K3YM36_SETIT